MKYLLSLAVTGQVAFILFSVIGMTALHDDPSPWDGWFVPLWAASLIGAVGVTMFNVALVMYWVMTGDDRPFDRRQR